MKLFDLKKIIKKGRRITTMVFITPFLLLLFIIWNGFFPTDHSVELKLNCSDELDIVTFQNLFKLNEIVTRSSFALVIADGVNFKGDTNEFCHLVNILKSDDNLTAIAGKSLFSWNPICTMVQKEWTLRFYHEYNKLIDGSNFIENKFTGKCYSCDLLPDLFVINLDHVKRLDNLHTLIPLGVSSHVPFFMKLKGRVAYCPKFNVNNYSNSTVEDFSCNNLSSRWDERFLLIPNVTGIYRIITPKRLEVWLGCVWIKSAYILNLPIHCSNLVRQYLFDVVDIIDKVMKVDYRISYGTLLGALRDSDVIPWTVDADIYPVVQSSEFSNFYDEMWRQLPTLSNRTYSYFGKDGNEHLDVAYLEAVRAFPMCPVILTSRKDLNGAQFVHNETRDRLISEQISKQNSIKRFNISKHDHWRNTGYVDIYTSSHISKCYINPLNEKFIWINVSNRRFKTFVFAKEFIECYYKASSTPPKQAKEFWTWFID